MDQQFHVVTTTQELRHSMRDFVRLVGDYLGDKGPLSWYMVTLTRHIDRFKRKYKKDFAGNLLFGGYHMDWIHKQVQVFLYSCNTMCLDGVDMGALSEFGEIPRRVE